MTIASCADLGCGSFTEIFGGKMTIGSVGCSADRKGAFFGDSGAVLFLGTIRIGSLFFGCGAVGTLSGAWEMVCSVGIAVSSEQVTVGGSNPGFGTDGSEAGRVCKTDPVVDAMFGAGWSDVASSDVFFSAADGSSEISDSRSFAGATAEATVESIDRLCLLLLKERVGFDDRVAVPSLSFSSKSEVFKVGSHFESSCEPSSEETGSDRSIGLDERSSASDTEVASFAVKSKEAEF